MTCPERKSVDFVRRIQYCEGWWIGGCEREGKCIKSTRSSTKRGPNQQISGEEKGRCGRRTADLASIRPNGRHTPFANGARLLAGPEPNSCLDWQKVINCKHITHYVYVNSGV